MLYIVVAVSVMCLFNNCLSETSESSYFIGGNRQNEKYNYKKGQDKNYTVDSPLTEFIQRYVNKINNYEDRNIYTTLKPENSEISLLWAGSHLPQNRDANKNKQEWVTLEAIPWSISKVSKWESKSKPKHNNPSDKMHSQTQHYLENMHPNKHKYQEHNKFNQKLAISNPLMIDDAKFKDNLKLSSQLPYSEVADDDTNHYLNKDVITDGLLPNFPVEYGDINRRYSSSTEKYAETYPVQSNGEWILLSTTKAYKRPKNTLRSLPILAGSTHPSVGLTVLPSVKNSNVNMSTSQGEVSQGLQTSVTKVDHDRSSFRRRKRTKIVKSNVIEDNDMQSANRITSTDEKQNYLDSSAVAAAVGAGMIPATMALLVPFAMGSKENRSINK